ncbi:hypothetical protein B0H14DRAFT_2332553, partial [Mycena olivaceomarginata]
FLASSLAGITKPDILCLLHHGGVKRTSELMCQETRGALKIFLLQVIRDAVGGLHGPPTVDKWAQINHRATLSAKAVVGGLCHC